MQAHHTRERAAWTRTAQLGHWVFVAWRGTKDSPTPAQLLGEERLNPQDAEDTLSELVGDGNASVAAFDRFMAQQKANVANT